MTKFENKFAVPQVPKTFQVLELRDQQQPVKKSNLSLAARSKVINRSGSNYFSEKEGYGPCHNCEGENKKLKFKLVIILKNCVGGEIGGTFYSTSAAEKAAGEIKNAEGHWEGDAKTSAFSQSNGDMLSDLGYRCGWPP